METKVYFASSIPAALEVARQELGEEAMLVGSRPAPKDARQYGRLEVTFAWSPASKPLAHARGSESSLPRGSESFLPNRDLLPNRDQSPSRDREGAIAALPSRDSLPSRDREGAVAARLIQNGFSPELAGEISAGVTEAAVVPELTRRIRVAEPTEARVIAFAGPPGRGKTTSLVKVAMQSGLSKRIPVRIYTAGAHGIGGKEQMARFAAILGAPWQACESLAGLDLALNGDPWKGLVLIDTPGISPAEGGELDELARFFAARPEIEKHLVLRAGATSADMLDVISRFSVLKPTRLLFTGLDEALSAAPMVESLIRSGIPAGWAGVGQQIPEDLAELNAERLARSAWMGDRAASAVDRARAALAAA